MKTINKLVAFMAMAMLSVIALADKQPRQGFYIAPEVANVTFKDFCSDLGSQETCSESEIGFGLLGGYQFNDFIAAEVGIRIARGFDYKYSAGKTDFDYKSYSLGGAARYPLGERFALTGKAGYHFWDVTANESVDGTRDSYDAADGSDLYFGGGLEFATGKMSFRAEYTRYQADDIDADVLSIGLVIPL